MDWEKPKLLALRVRKVLSALQTKLGRRALKSGMAPSIEHRHLRALRVKHVLDIGANRGQFSLFASEAFGIRRIDAFEPLPQCAADIKTFLPFVEVHQVALSDSIGQQNFHISRADDSSSLRGITSNQEKYFPGTGEAATQTVSVTTFETWCGENTLERPSLAKIDVQGSELNVLRGMGGAIELIDYIYVELSFVELYSGQALAGEVICHLENRNFRIVGLYNVKRSGVRAIQADALFCRAGFREEL